jgi:hypothetical protein
MGRWQRRDHATRNAVLGQYASRAAFCRPKIHSVKTTVATLDKTSPTDRQHYPKGISRVDSVITTTSTTDSSECQKVASMFGIFNGDPFAVNLSIPDSSMKVGAAGLCISIIF